MCRSIKKLRKSEKQPTQQEVNEAALQFVRKISGYRAPSRKNEEAFQRAVEDIAKASNRLLQELS
jgi:hypothetical protein